MKLYTEKQIRESLNNNFTFGDMAIDLALNKMTPIELPSDEEMEEMIKESVYYEFDDGYAQGAVWVIELIKKQDK